MGGASVWGLMSLPSSLLATKSALRCWPFGSRSGSSATRGLVSPSGTSENVPKTPEICCFLGYNRPIKSGAEMISARALPPAASGIPGMT